MPMDMRSLLISLEAMRLNASVPMRRENWNLPRSLLTRARKGRNTLVCVNSTSGGEEALATPAYQGWLARIPLPLGAAVNKIKGATLTPPNAQARALRMSASPAPGIGVQSLSSSSTIAGSVVCVEGGRRPLSLAKSKSIG